MPIQFEMGNGISTDGQSMRHIDSKEPIKIIFLQITRSIKCGNFVTEFSGKYRKTSFECKKVILRSQLGSNDDVVAVDDISIVDRACESHRWPIHDFAKVGFLVLT